MTGGAWLRRIAFLLVLAVLGVAVLTARVVADGERALALSDEAFDRGDTRGATFHARRAAISYAPGAPHVEPAYERLIAIATGAEAAGERELALEAWGAIRAASLETRHLWVARPEHLDRANQNLARLALPPDVSPREARARTQIAMAELGRDDAPRAPWILLLALGFALAAAGLTAVAWRGITPDGELVMGTVRLATAIFLAGAICWTVAVLYA